MEGLTQRMRKQVADVQGFLAEGRFLSIGPEEREALLAESRKLVERLDAVSDEILVAGLLGGTGVGKSTLMNALAGASIASTSHRRPDTDRVLLYRHEKVEPPRSLLNTPVPWSEVTHSAEGARRILLCDLPDLDSFVASHRERVLAFLEHLDVLVLVTSPEKYADRALYAFLEGVPKARPNFYFVLNKVDLLFQGQDLEPGYRQLENVAGLFLQYLRGAGMTEPVLFCLSAEEAIRDPEPRPWNQFPAFRREILRDREAKEILAVKSANLDEEVRGLLARLEGERAYLDGLGRFLEENAERFARERNEWEGQGQEILDLWVDTEIKGYVLGRLETLAPLVGPGYGVARLHQEWREWKGARSEAAGGWSSEAVSVPPEELRGLLEGVENRILHRALHAGLPGPYRERLRAVLDLEAAWKGLSSRWREQIELHLLAQRAPLLVGFRVVQYAVYLALLLLLLMALADEEAARWLLRDPGLASFLQVLFSLVKGLFSGTGLGALATFGLLMGALGVGFYRRYRGRLEARARKTLRDLKAVLGRTWAEELDRIHGALLECRREVSAQQDRLARRLSG